MIQILNEMIECLNPKMKDKAINKIYIECTRMGYNTCLLNDRYIIVNEKQYALRVSKGKLKVVEF